MTEVERKVRAAAQEYDRARSKFVEVVRQAHRAGMTWTALGRVLGVSRQAAWQRFHLEEEGADHE